MWLLVKLIGLSKEVKKVVIEGQDIAKNTNDLDTLTNILTFTFDLPNVRKQEYDTVMNGFKELGFQIVYICHGKDKEIKLRGQESYKQFVPDVSASFDYAVLGAVDFVFYLEKTRVKDASGESREVRRLILQKPELIQDRTVFHYFFLIR